MTRSRILFLTAFILLCACGGPSTPKSAERYAVGSQKAETLLTTEMGSQEPHKIPRDPLAAHMWARKQVDPNKRGDSQKYTTLAEAVEKQQNDAVRVVQLKKGTIRSASEDVSVPVVDAAVAVDLIEAPYPQQKPGYQSQKVMSSAASVALDQDRVVANVVDAPYPLSKPVYAETVSDALVYDPRTNSNSRELDVVKPKFKPVIGLKTQQASLSSVREGREDPVVVQEERAQGKDIIKSIRIGAHPGKTRIVFDVTSPVSFHPFMKPDQKTLTVEFDGADWQAEDRKEFGGHEFLNHYQVSRQAGKVLVDMGLKAPGRVVEKHIYPPNEVYNNHRIVIDVSLL